jgi:hypothetical protein
MKIYRKIYRSYATSESVEISDKQEELYEMGEISLEELFENKEKELLLKKEYPEIEYEDREFNQEIEYNLSWN